MTHADIDHASIYDSFTITVIESLEHLGFCEKGKGGEFVLDGALQARFGKLPFTTDGGGLCNNHPSDRGGVIGVLEAVRQRRGEANKEVQVPNCQIALAHGTGGEIGTRMAAQPSFRNARRLMPAGASAVHRCRLSDVAKNADVLETRAVCLYKRSVGGLGVSDFSSIVYQGKRQGRGPTVVMIPSLGRTGSDFDHLAGALVAEGYSALALTPSVTIGKTQQTFEDLADEIVRHAVADSNPRPLHLIGHAYGQALARCVVARWPEVFASLTLLACGGSMPSDDILASARAATDVALAARDPDQHLRHVARAFFAPGNDATAWSTGWLTAEADVEMYVLMSTSSEHRLPVALPKTLVIQGIHDAIAPPQHGRAFQQINPAAELIELDGAGHAILPEQPETVARIVLDFLAANASS